jgi:hypothetical protein
MGLNNSGQLGIGDYGNRFTPVEVTKDVLKISGGHSHSLFVKIEQRSPFFNDPKNFCHSLSCRNYFSF